MISETLEDKRNEKCNPKNLRDVEVQKLKAVQGTKQEREDLGSENLATRPIKAIDSGGAPKPQFVEENENVE